MTDKELIEKCRLDENERLGCSLVSKYPLCEVGDVITETQEHVLDKAIPIIRKAVEAENLKLRYLLWAGHACDGKYGDDGELQCNRFPSFIDFKRDSVDELERKCAIHNLQRQGIAIPDFLLGAPSGRDIET